MTLEEAVQYIEKWYQPTTEEKERDLDRRISNHGLRVCRKQKKGTEV